ncbi:NAD(P)-binding protein [Phyllosticta citribraziliensis]|uniref:NAD(P)-binding protein n=1 Tax=Phyllosticta citribraziliensis TaxID=989973 RepID=A0ABR1LTJ8_9PEZI
MAPSTPHVLLIGGHGKVAQLMTPLLLARSWAVTSLIREQAQVPTIEKLGHGQPGKLNVLVRSVEDVRTERDAKSILDEVKPSWVVWSAGAGGRGGAPRTYAIDRDAAKAFIRASTNTPSITTFLMISWLGSRRVKPSWWNDADWAGVQHTFASVLPTYADAKLAADEYLVAAAAARGDGFRAINLRPGTLSDVPSSGKAELGRTSKFNGKASRELVAQTAAELLGSGYKGGWLDLLDGEVPVKEAVEQVTREGVDVIEGEDVERILKTEV